MTGEADKRLIANLRAMLAHARDRLRELEPPSHECDEPDDDSSPHPYVVSLEKMQGLVSRSHKPCPRCGLTNALNPHRMCKRKVAVLADLAQFLRDDDEWVRVEEGRELQGLESKARKTTAYRASAHTNRLLWFGLVDGAGFRTAEWRINLDGLLFLMGDFQVPAKILCTQGSVIYQSEESVGLKDIQGVDLDKDYWDDYPWSDFIEGL